VAGCRPRGQKDQVHLRLDNDVVAALRSAGDGWQTKGNGFVAGPHRAPSLEATGFFKAKDPAFPIDECAHMARNISGELASMVSIKGKAHLAASTSIRRGWPQDTSLAQIPPGANGPGGRGLTKDM